MKNKSVNEDTLNRIVACGKQEFLQCGFKDGSMRNIAASAEMTTGAIYGNFENKDALFDYIVSPLCDKFDAWMAYQTEDYVSTDEGPGSISIEKTIQSVEGIYFFLYEYFVETKLLADCSQGSSRERYLHDIVQYDVDNTMKYIKQYKKFNGTPTKDIDKFVVHTLAESYLNSILEPIRHNLTLDEALTNCKAICAFYTQGWVTLLNA